MFTLKALDDKACDMVKACRACSVIPDDIALLQIPATPVHARPLGGGSKARRHQVIQRLPEVHGVG